METKYFEYFVTLLCGLVFILLMEDIWIKFNSKLTNTGIKFTHIDDPNRLLPFLTVCPMPGYKKIGTFYREEDFHENTFELEDIFADSFLAKLKNTSNFSIKTIRTIVYGRCYTIQILQKISGLEVEDCLKFKREFDVNLLVHTEGDEVWLTLGLSPYLISNVRIKSREYNDGVSSADIAVSEVQTTSISKENNLCENYNYHSSGHLAFVQCYKNFIKIKLEKEITCSTPILKDIPLNRSSIPICGDKYSALNTSMQFINIIKDFTENPNRFGCLPPCKITNFKIDLTYYHKNSWSIFEEFVSLGKDFGIYYFYNTLQIEEKVETLIFDFGGLLAAAGGNLGLCLGFSCLSIFYSIIHLISILMKKIKLMIGS